MAELLFDIVNPTELQGYIRGLSQEENLNKYTLSNFLPVEEVASTEFRVVQGNLQDVSSAKYRSFDAESVIARRRSGARLTGSLPPVSMKIRLGEEERLKLEQLQRGGDSAELVQTLYDDAGDMTRAVLARLELARGSVLEFGLLAINENGFDVTLDYGRTGAHTVTAGTLWSNTSSSDPVSDLRAWSQTYLNTNGILPGYALMSSAVAANLLRNANIRTLSGSLSGTPAQISVATLGQIFDAFGLPPIVVYDTQVRVDGTATRVVSSNKVLLLPPTGEPLGGVFTGITAEALELVNAGFLTAESAPGLTGVISKDFDPVATWTKVAAIAVPVLANPNLTFTATVQ